MFPFVKVRKNKYQPLQLKIQPVNAMALKVELRDSYYWKNNKESEVGRVARGLGVFKAKLWARRRVIDYYYVSVGWLLFWSWEIILGVIELFSGDVYRKLRISESWKSGAWKLEVRWSEKLSVRDAESAPQYSFLFVTNGIFLQNSWLCRREWCDFATFYI